jgi:hypothetical protein
MFGILFFFSINVLSFVFATLGAVSDNRLFITQLMTQPYDAIDVAKLSIFLGEKAWGSEYFKTLKVFAGRLYWVMGSEVKVLASVCFVVLFV